MQVRQCEECGKPVALVNVDKMRGVVGLRLGWVHVSRHGRIKLRKNHNPVVTERK